MDNNKIWFFKPNQLIMVVEENKSKTSRLARLLCNYFLRYAQEQIKVHNYKGTWFELDIKDLNSLAAIKQKNLPHIEKALDALIHPVTIESKDKSQLLKIALIAVIHVDFSRGKYRYQLSDTMIEILKVTNYFTQLNLLELNPLTSKHSIVFYEWFKQFQKLDNLPKLPPLRLDKLQLMTSTNYDNFTNLKKNVIDVAVNEISEKTPYIVTYETLKERTRSKPKVTAIQFYFSKKEIKTEAENKHENPVNAPLPSTYEKLRKVCGRYMTLKFYYEATYIYTPETLEQFADDCIAKSYHPNKKEFFEWLNERCGIDQKGYFKQQVILNEELFRDVFAIKEKKYSMMIPTGNGESMPAGLPEIIVNVNEEYVAEAMKPYGKLPYNEYKHYLSELWQRFQQQFNVNEDNVFE